MRARYPQSRRPRSQSLLADASTFSVSTGRRMLDITVGSLLLVALAPLLAATAVAILVSDGRPVFFRQERLGERGHPFTLVKFRTMRAGSGPDVTSTTDARITRLGRLLRRTAVDELPQLWHVLRGQMTLVGPRPESESLARRYPESCRWVLQVRPGLTGPAQLRYREASAVPPNGSVSVEEWYLSTLVPLRVDSDLDFLERPTTLHTFRYMLLTLGFVTGVVDTEQQVPQGHAPSPQARIPTQRTPSGAHSRIIPPASPLGGSQAAFAQSPALRSTSRL